MTSASVAVTVGDDTVTSDVSLAPWPMSPFGVGLTAPITSIVSAAVTYSTARTIEDTLYRAIPTANGVPVTFRNCKFVVRPRAINGAAMVFEDCEWSGDPNDADHAGTLAYLCNTSATSTAVWRRCYGHHMIQFQHAPGAGWTFEDCYFSDTMIYVSTSGEHVDGIAPFGGSGDLTIRRCNISSKLSPESPFTPATSGSRFNRTVWMKPDNNGAYGDFLLEDSLFENDDGGGGAWSVYHVTATNSATGGSIGSVTIRNCSYVRPSSGQGHVDQGGIVTTSINNRYTDTQELIPGSVAS